MQTERLAKLKFEKETLESAFKTEKNEKERLEGVLKQVQNNRNEIAEHSKLRESELTRLYQEQETKSKLWAQSEAELKFELLKTNSNHVKKISEMEKSLSEIEAKLEAKESEVSILFSHKRDIEAKYLEETNSLKLQIAILQAEYHKKELEHEIVNNELHAARILIEDGTLNIDDLKAAHKNLETEASDRKKHELVLETSLRLKSEIHLKLESVLEQQVNEIKALNYKCQVLAENKNSDKLKFTKINGQSKIKEHEMVLERHRAEILRIQKHLETMDSKASQVEFIDNELQVKAN